MNTQELLDQVFEENAPKVQLPPISEIRDGARRRTRQRATMQYVGAAIGLFAIGIITTSILTSNEPSSLATGAAQDGIDVDVDAPSDVEPQDEEANPEHGDATSEPEPVEPGQVEDDSEFWPPLKRGRWKLAEASPTFPDGDVPEQGIFFWTQAKPWDRIGFYGRSCHGLNAFLEWDEPGVATVVPDETGIIIRTPMSRCSEERAPGIVNHPPALGSSFDVQRDGEFIDVTFRDADGTKQWTARFEYHQFHILEDR